MDVNVLMASRFAATRIGVTTRRFDDFDVGLYVTVSLSSVGFLTDSDEDANLTTFTLVERFEFEFGSTSSIFVSSDLDAEC